MEFITKEVIYQKSSQEITSLLYESLLDELNNSIEDIEAKNYLYANKRLQKVNDILHRLGAGLNYEAGIIAEQLDALYNYMADSVIEANRVKDETIVQEVLSIAEKIVDAWNTAMKSKPAPRPSLIQKRVSAYEQNIMTLEK